MMTEQMTPQQWQETVFKPWQEQAQAVALANKQNLEKLKIHKPRLKYMLALLCEKQEAEVVRLWNELKLDPALQHVDVNLETTLVTLMFADGRRESILFEKLVDMLAKVLNA